MSTINPFSSPLSSVSGTARLAQLSPVAAKQKPVESAPLGDQVQLRSSASNKAEKSEATRPTSSWLRNVTLGAVGVATLVGCGLAGGGSGAAVGAAQAKTVQVKQQTRSNAPAVLHQEQQGTLELQSARFGVTPTVRSFGDLPVRIQQDDRVETKTASDGSQIENEISIDRVESNSGQLLYANDEAEVNTLDFHDRAEQSWMTSSQLKPAGNFGKYFSVSEVNNNFTGGASASTETRLRTVNSETGKVVNLSEIVSPEDYQKIAKHVQSGLNSFQGLNYQAEDAETLDSHLNNGFSLHQQKDGKVLLTVAIPGQIDAEGGQVAEFTFRLPASSIAH